MIKYQKASLFILRISLGWVFLYAGITKILNPNWTAAGFLKGATNMTGFFNYLMQPNVLPAVDLLNQLGLTLLGVSLILGLFVRVSAPSGVVLMVLYYLPKLDFPHPSNTSYIVDDHIVYALVLIYFAVINAGKYWGLDALLTKKLSKNPKNAE